MPVKAKSSIVQKQEISSEVVTQIKAKTLFTPSKELSVIVGKEPLRRNQALKSLWGYIKENKLQDTRDGRNIKADSKLKPIFNEDSISMFKITGLLAKHLKKQ